MDVSYCSAAAPLPEIHSQLPFDYEALMGPGCWAPPPEACDQASDSGYFSASGSSLSPTSSVDSFSFSPAHLSAAAAAATTTTAAAAAAAAGPEPDDLDCLLSSLNRLTGAPPPPAAAAAAVSGCSARTQQSGSSSPAEAPASSAAASTTTTTRRSWSRFPGRKRQTASEREKMRMRDLTKSLNYLRSFLPASVAPAGQTLTKIETLRLTMRYIAHLSAQLGHAGPESAPEAGGAAAAPPTQQNLPAFQPMVEQPRNGSYVPEEPLLLHHHHNHHYRHVVMDTVSHQQNQAAEQQVPPQNHYQGSGSFGSPLFNGQYWTSADLLQQNMFSS